MLRSTWACPPMVNEGAIRRDGQLSGRLGQQQRIKQFRESLRSDICTKGTFGLFTSSSAVRRTTCTYSPPDADRREF